MESRIDAKFSPGEMGEETKESGVVKRGKEAVVRTV